MVKTTSPYKENGALKHKLSVRNFLWGIHLISKSRIDSTAQDYRNYDTETLWNSHIKLLLSVESESNKYITALYL